MTRLIGTRRALLGATAIIAVAGPTTDPNVTAINADGASAQYTSPPAGNPAASPPTYGFDIVNNRKNVVLSRPGYTMAGATTTYTEALGILTRGRDIYPNQAQYLANTVFMTDYAYISDSCAGVTNNSTQVSPKPISGWITQDRQTIGNSIGAGTVSPVETWAAQRNGRNGQFIACAIYKITDSASTSKTYLVNSPSATSRTGDQGDTDCWPVPALNLATEGFVTGLLKIDCKHIPWIGPADGSNINDSSANGTNPKDFTTRFYNYDNSRYTNPPICYVDAVSGTSGGVWSTNDATAKATPFDTAARARDAALPSGAYHTTTGGYLDGCIFKGVGTQHFPYEFPANDATVLRIAGPIFTRGSSTSRASCVWQIDDTHNFLLDGNYSTIGLNAALVEPAISVTDCTVQRGGTAGSQLSRTAGYNTCAYYFSDINFDNATSNIELLAISGAFGANASFVNMTVTNFGAKRTFAAANDIANPLVGRFDLFRGVVATGGTFQQGTMVCSKITEGGPFSRGTGYAWSNIIISGNWFINPVPGTATGGFISTGTGSAATIGLAVVQNKVEFTSATQDTVAGYFNDGTTANATHVIIGHNSCTGWTNYGRYNMFYDETVGTVHTSKLHLFIGEIPVQVNSKGDWYVGDPAGHNNAADAPSHIGNRAFLHGTACYGIMCQYLAANGGGLGTTFTQLHGGLGSKFSTSATRQDPLYAVDHGTTGSPTAGTEAGSDMHIPLNSPAAGIVPFGVMTHDFDGNVRRAVNDDAGAYKAA